MAAVLRRHFDPHRAWEAPFVFFVRAILTSARAGGMAAGILATLLGVGYDPRVNSYICRPVDFEQCGAAAEQPGFTGFCRMRTRPQSSTGNG